MNRLLAVMLIPFLAFGNAFAHSHEGEFAPANHSERPHFHVEVNADVHGGHHHGDHHHHSEHRQSGLEHEASGQPPVGHDSDAVYLGVGHPFVPVAGTPRVAPASDCGCFLVAVPDGVAPIGHRSAACSNVFQRIGPPLFLLHAALRL